MSLPFFALWVVGPLVLGTLLTVLLTRRSRRQHPSLSRIEEWIVGLVSTGAILVAAASIYTVAVVLTGPSSNGDVTVRGFELANASSPAFTERADAIVDAHYETVSLTVAGVPSEVRWLLALEHALPAVASLAISAAVAWLGILLLRGRPFVRSFTNVIGVASIAVLIGGIGAQIAASGSRAAIVEFLGPEQITAGDHGDGPYEGLMAWMLNLDLSPLGWALGLALVAAAFQLGTRMQRDTEGLV